MITIYLPVFRLSHHPFLKTTPMPVLEQKILCYGYDGGGWSFDWEVIGIGETHKLAILDYLKRGLK